MGRLTLVSIRVGSRRLWWLWVVIDQVHTTIAQSSLVTVHINLDDGTRQPPAGESQTVGLSMLTLCRSNRGKVNVHLKTVCYANTKGVSALSNRITFPFSPIVNNIKIERNYSNCTDSSATKLICPCRGRKSTMASIEDCVWFMVFKQTVSSAVQVPSSQCSIHSKLDR